MVDGEFSLELAIRNIVKCKTSRTKEDIFIWLIGSLDKDCDVLVIDMDLFIENFIHILINHKIKYSCVNFSFYYITLYLVNKKITFLSLKNFIIFDTKSLISLVYRDFDYYFLNYRSKYFNDPEVIKEMIYCFIYENRKKFKHFTPLYCYLINIVQSKLSPLGIDIFKKKTLPASAFYYLKNKYKFIEMENSFSLNNFIKKSYFGGRCEVFGNSFSNKIILHFDFESMYPGCMLGDFPVGLGKITKPNDFDKPGFYTIKYLSNQEIPVLPSRDSSLVFLNGIQVGTFWVEEIMLFIREGGTVMEIINAVIFEESYPVFKNIIEDFDSVKNKDFFGKKLHKMILNSVYGKMLRTQMSKKNIICTCVYDGNAYQELVDGVYLRSEDMELNLKNIATASVITSRARIKLYNAFKDVIKFGGKLLYSDTDSVIASFDKSNNPINKRLGSVYFNSEKKDTEISMAVFKACKNYRILFKDDEENIKNSQTLENLLEFKNNLFHLKDTKGELYLYKKRKFSKDLESTQPLWIEEYSKLSK